jgi:hypothetical protein
LGVNKYHLRRGWGKLRGDKLPVAKTRTIFANEGLWDLLNMQVKLAETNR